MSSSSWHYLTDGLHRPWVSGRGGREMIKWAGEHWRQKNRICESKDDFKEEPQTEKCRRLKKEDAERGDSDTNRGIWPRDRQGQCGIKRERE